MSIGNEFKEFILRGKVVDLAVGVAVGGAFTKIIDVLVKEIVMPFFALFANGIEFNDWKLVLRAASANHAEIAVHYGILLNAIFAFFIVGWVVFLVIRVLNRFHSEDKTDQTKITNELLREMRDLMAKNNLAQSQ